MDFARRKFAVRNVVHYKMEFTRACQVRKKKKKKRKKKKRKKKKKKISGTQTIERVWRQLKRCLPFSLASQDPETLNE